MMIPFLPLASWKFTGKERKNLIRDSHILSKSQASKGYLPSQLQEILTLVRKYECSDSYYVSPSNVSIASRATCCDKHAENLSETMIVTNFN